MQVNKKKLTHTQFSSSTSSTFQSYHFFQLTNCLQLEDDDRDRKTREDDEEKKGDKVELDIPKVVAIENFRKLPSNLTISTLSPELNKSF